MEGQVQEFFAVGGDVLWIFWPCILRRTNFENCLHLSQLHPWMLTCEHFHYKTAEGPNVGFSCIASLLDDLRGHPEDGALQGRSMYARCRSQQVYMEQVSEAQGSCDAIEKAHSLPPF